VPQEPKNRNPPALQFVRNDEHGSIRSVREFWERSITTATEESHRGHRKPALIADCVRYLTDTNARPS